MKKASKILTLILVFVLLAGVFSGCALFTRNTGRYRSLVAVTVGEQEITVGKVLDSFNNYYNTYGSYIGQGITVDWLLQMTMQSLVTQAMKVDSYTSDATPQTHSLADFCRNAKYLTQEEMEYSIRYVKYITYQTFDSSVQDLIAVGRTINDEKAEDTSRDFTEYDELKADTYSEHLYRSNVFGDDAGEYFDKYYGGMSAIGLNTSVDEYIYATEAAASAMLDNLNGRLEEDDAKITYAEYKNAQQKVVTQYKRTISKTYGIEFEKFMTNQIEDMVASIIVAKYDYNVNKAIDTTNLTATLAQLKNNLAINTSSQAAGFALNNDFVSFIQSLGSSSYIYNVPDEYDRSKNDGDGYIFVKNILIPFTAQQTTTLANLAKDLGNDTTNPAYVALRNEYATQVVAKDFLTDEDENGKRTEYENLFELKTVDGVDKLVVKDGSVLSEVFKADGVVDASDYEGDKTAAVIDYMKRFNTDTAQHKAEYDYVVRVGKVPSNYTAQWVPEFVDAANEAADIGVGSYALAISTYGVHIVYYVADVTAQQFDFDNNYLDTTKPEYKLFNSYFSQQSSLLLNEKVEDLEKSYLDKGLIKTTKNFDRFLKDNDFTFDLIEYLTHED